MEVLRKHHIVAMGHKEKDCYFFHTKGFCRNGDFCRFKHGSKRQQTQTNTRQTPRFERENMSSRQCKYQGSCFQFPNCRFRHNEVCQFQNMCRFKENCRFVHFDQNSPSPFLGIPYQSHMFY